MSRIIRNARARELQGQRAGALSRGLAFAADIGIAFVVYLAIVAGVSLLWDIFFSDELTIPAPPPWFSLLMSFLVLVVYLALGWGSTGRTIGKQLLGLRVVRRDARPLTPGQAWGRALLCAVFYPGLLLALVDRRNRSVQDVVCRSVVVYDWIPESARPRRFPSATVQPVGDRTASGQERP
ncbi:MAG: RDD family protein [Actinomycetota bacterium]